MNKRNIAREDMPPILFYEEACQRNMTFGDVVRYYDPTASEEKCERVIKAAMDDCALKFMVPDHHKNIVTHIYYVVAYC